MNQVIITHILIYRFSIHMRPFSIATGTMNYTQNVFIRVYTDAGFYGVGECSAFPVIVGETQQSCMVLAEEFAKLWIGKDALDITARLKQLDDFVAFNTTIKSAFDMALYDIAAKYAGLPLYKYLGGTKRVVETDITIGIDTPDAMADKAVALVQSGARILKIKVGNNVQADIDRIKKIRLAVGEEVIIRVDANQGWSFDDALLGLQKMARYHIEFCEQPMRSWYDDRLPELIERSAVKIMADESMYNHHDARKLIQNRACDYINIKFSKSGGITEALRIHQVAGKRNIPCMMGGMLESRIGLSAKLHFVYACPHIKFYDLDTCLLGHLEDPCVGGAIYNGYFLDIPDTPGIGADADDGFLKKCESVMID